MATIKQIAQYTALVLFLLCPFCAIAQTEFKGGPPAKSYLPGDFIHIMVEAPVDTASISATLPDNMLVKMVYDRQSSVWHGLWQVPFGFKTGTYYAKLNAIDLEGNTFIGQSAPFVIGEQTMVLLVGKATPEVIRKPTVAKKPEKEEELPAETTTEVRMTEVRPKAAAAKPGEKPKEDLEKHKRDQLLKVRFAVAARFYIERLDFITVRRKLQTLIRIEPGNKELKTMLKRVDAIIKAKGGGR